MVRKSGFFLAALLLAAVVVVAGCSGRVSEFGYVDLQKVMQESPKVKVLQEKIDQKVQEAQKLNEQDDALFEKEKGGLGKEELEKRQQQLSESRQLRQTELMLAGRDAEEEFKTLLQQAMGEVAKEKKLGAVLVKNGVLYGGVDITDDVLKKIN